MTHKGSSGSLPSGCCNGAPCRASRAALLIGCGALQGSRDLKAAAPRCWGSGCTSLAGCRASWESMTSDMAHTVALQGSHVTPKMAHAAKAHGTLASHRVASSGVQMHSIFCCFATGPCGSHVTVSILPPAGYPVSCSPLARGPCGSHMTSNMAPATRVPGRQPGMKTPPGACRSLS